MGVNEGANTQPFDYHEALNKRFPHSAQLRVSYFRTLVDILSLEERTDRMRRPERPHTRGAA